MYFSKLAVILSVATSALAATTGTEAAQKQKRALTFQTYNDFQISSGTAGNALAEAQAAFPVSSDLASVSDSDLAIIKAARETAEAAETDAFNDAVDAASGDAATALQNGKIKNKVLKLYLETTALQIEQAQGDDNQDKIDAEQKKLDTNVALDEKAAGEDSTAVSFTDDVQPDN
ncbi:hypothetical protein PFICI_01407 [Pestalotiopsis fici W106-1]|uniref:Small secreted protein n=1 Tax=Pestalotiopsis fici (strain W106-1 / CGMCC3.15140) TaxID=1229662 RepID=W3XNM2_PESFW|nr:uncharacterized protein PFICI_01407 [Pestalotiopsis fici W106-1]ETS87579.1 hypothetical protein PFICI_01407 [Pestalotiopsis fici W106-1]